MEEFITDYAKLSEKLALLGELLAKYSADSELIKKVDEGVRWAILRKTAYSLPNRPSDAGMTPEQIKTAFYRAFTDAEQSVLAELDRVVNEVDKEFLSLSDIVKEIVASLELSQNGISESFKTIEGEIEKNREGIAGCIKRSEKSGGTFAYVTDGGKDNVIQVARDSNPLSIPLRYTNGRVRVGSPVEDEDAVTLAHLRGGYLGNAGVQVLDGSLTISGDILVGGEAKAKQLESIEVADACIIANADGVPLAELSGYVIRVTAEQAYAIVYDPIAQCVKIGLGVYDGEAKVFTFNEGEAQPLATRGELADGELPVWDGEKNTLKGSGLKVKDVTEQHAAFARREEVAGALEGFAVGEAVALKDVSKVEHGFGVRVSSKNLADIYAFSAYGMISPSLTNAYGTTISTTEPSDSVEIVQSQTGNQTSVTSYTNGYFCIGFRNHFKDGDKITLSFDLEIKENPLNAKVWKFFMNGTSGEADVSTTSGRVSAVIEWRDKDDGKPYIEIRNAGCSCVVSNIQLEKGTTATAYTPFVPDVGAVKLRAQGANVLDTTNAPMFGTYSPNFNRGYEYEKTSTGFRCLCGTGASVASARFGYQAVSIEPLRGKTLTLSFKRYSTLDDTNTSACGVIQAGDNELNNGYTYIGDALSNRVTYGETLLKDAINGYFKCTFTVPKDETRKNLFVALYLGINAVAAKDSIVEYSDIQLEIDGATEYEPYIEPVEYAVSADGTVEGVKSIYPATTLTTDTVGALIEVDYNRDINKAFEELRKVILSLGGIL